MFFKYFFLGKIAFQSSNSRFECLFQPPPVVYYVLLKAWKILHRFTVDKSFLMRTSAAYSFLGYQLFLLRIFIKMTIHAEFLTT